MTMLLMGELWPVMTPLGRWFMYGFQSFGGRGVVLRGGKFSRKSEERLFVRGRGRGGRHRAYLIARKYDAAALVSEGVSSDVNTEKWGLKIR